MVTLHIFSHSVTLFNQEILGLLIHGVQVVPMFGTFEYLFGFSYLNVMGETLPNGNKVVEIYDVGFQAVSRDFESFILITLRLNLLKSLQISIIRLHRHPIIPFLTGIILIIDILPKNSHSLSILIITIVNKLVDVKFLAVLSQLHQEALFGTQTQDVLFVAFDDRVHESKN